METCPRAVRLDWMELSSAQLLFSGDTEAQPAELMAKLESEHRSALYFVFATSISQLPQTRAEGMGLRAIRHMWLHVCMHFVTAG